MKNMNIKFNNFITNVSLDRSRIIVDFKGDKFDDLKVKWCGIKKVDSLFSRIS